ncbi:hypothetical protein BH18THE2_BH18THE2_29170 [soil metagenome]
MSLKPVGINFHCYGSAAYQNRCTPIPPSNYVEDSFRIFADSKIVCVRVTFHWESWELDPDLCCEDLKNIAEIADKYGIMCIYDNHQWECSSWIGCGVGMPNSLMSVNCKKRTGRSKPDRNTKENFWRKWWNRKILTADGEDGWDAQLDFLSSIVKLLDGHKSTFGFEVLNEPEVYKISDYKNVGRYHHYIIKELRRITDKSLLFSWALPHGGVTDNPILQALVSPKIKDNVLYDSHSYPPSISRMMYFRLISFLMGNIPVYMGEFSSGFTNGTILTQEQLSAYVKRFEKFGTHGWALWRWSYIEDKNIPAFNLTRIIENRIQPGPIFNHYAIVLRTLNLQGG